MQLNFTKVHYILLVEMLDDTDYRLLGCGSYLAFYRFENDMVLIDRILHGRQDYITILLGKTEEDE